MKKKFRSTVQTHSDLLTYLSERFTYYNREKWESHLCAGNIRVGEKKVLTNCPVKPGDQIIFEIPEEDSREPPVDKNWSLIYEDDWIVAVHKPGDLPVHPAGRYHENTLLSLIQKEFPEKTFFTVHRIDRETSGIVLFAKQEKVAKSLGNAFRTKNIKKTYLVWVWGCFPEYPVFYKGILVKDPESAIHKKLQFRLDSQGNVETWFSRLGYRDGISLLLARPITGKTHQIRATLQSLGYPILGDKIYGKRDTAFLDFLKKGMDQDLVLELGHTRQALHALSLEFIHPVLHVPVEIYAPFPDFDKEKKLKFSSM